MPKLQINYNFNNNIINNKTIDIQNNDLNSIQFNSYYNQFIVNQNLNTERMKSEDNYSFGSNTCNPFVGYFNYNNNNDYNYYQYINQLNAYNLWPQLIYQSIPQPLTQSIPQTIALNRFECNLTLIETQSRYSQQIVNYSQITNNYNNNNGFDQSISLDNNSQSSQNQSQTKYLLNEGIVSKRDDKYYCGLCDKWLTHMSLAFIHSTNKSHLKLKKGQNLGAINRSIVCHRKRYNERH